MKSLKFLLAAALPLLALSNPVHASEAFEKEVLSALVLNAGQIQLTSDIDADLGAPFQVAEMIAQSLSSGYLSARQGGSIMLS
ncbi:MAG: hypothetical protein EOP11_06320, partial [Proteobacteria bacterium]